MLKYAMDNLDKARIIRATYNPSDLNFEATALRSFQKTSMHSQEFKLRLDELVIIACHQIAAHLFNLDEGAHKHQLYQDWAQHRRMEQILASEVRDIIPPSAFFHTSYTYIDQYPQGLADVVGYWAEGQIFGGVVVFDCGETESECKSMWIHGARIRGPRLFIRPRQTNSTLSSTFYYPAQKKGLVALYQSMELTRIALGGTI
ncbi:hypothetical protein FSHL1_009056 [Fusarium sambucinum]